MSYMLPEFLKLLLSLVFLLVANLSNPFLPLLLERQRLRIVPIYNNEVYKFYYKVYWAVRTGGMQPRMRPQGKECITKAFR